MSEQQVQKLYDLINTTLEGANILKAACESKDDSGFINISSDINIAYDSILLSVKNRGVEGYIFACESIIDSLGRIASLYKLDISNCACKIEFELIPLIRVFKMRFYFFEIAQKDEGKFNKYLSIDRFLLGSNHYIDQAEETGVYKYELSIVVIAFNKLDYTQACVTNLLKYIPSDLNYELILINHGSSDGTKEFFEQIKPHKQIDISKNGGGLSLTSLVVEGEYCLTVSNDVVVTENAIQNLMACIKSDTSISFVVPATPNVSNMQSIPANYTDIEGMHKFASENNKLDPLKWEQRVRLCNPIDIYSTKHIVSSKGVQHTSYFISSDYFLFPDDVLTFLLRKQGLKIMLAKDAYCYHHGSVTIKDENARKSEEEYYENGRKSFQKNFGIDPWGKGFCYDPILFQELNLQKKDNAKILGISPGMGSNPLKFKTLLRELGSENTELYLATEKEHFKVDYETYTNPEQVTITTASNFPKVFPNEKFDYITVEFPINPIQLKAFKKRLKPGGMLLVSVESQAFKKLGNTNPGKKINSSGCTWFVYS